MYEDFHDRFGCHRHDGCCERSSREDDEYAFTRIRRVLQAGGRERPARQGAQEIPRRVQEGVEGEGINDISRCPTGYH
jgi:hypothetical protein